MKFINTRRALFAALLATGPLVASACDLQVNAPWIREAPPSARVLAAYMTLENKGDSPCVVRAVSSPVFGDIHIHRTVMQDGMARMVMQAGLTIPAHDRVIARPGGLHFMLMQPKRPISAGETIPMQLELGDGKSHTLQVPVRNSNP